MRWTGARPSSGPNRIENEQVPENFQLPRTPIEQYSLDNGLRVVLSRDTAMPVVSVVVYYDVGSRNERFGRTGFAHLFEHMMFQGSENVPKAGHFQFIFNAGGTMNGTTSTERTNYFETLPANQLPLALWLESDRMRSLKVTQENLDNQRQAVQEEKRLRYDNQPYINAFLMINELIFLNPANAHSTIGSMEDLDAATIDDIREFFRIYYAPNNAVLTVVGDFEEDQAKALIDKYFSGIPRQPLPPPVDVTEPPQVGKFQASYHDKLAPAPAFILGWKIPARRTPDHYALALAADLLFAGESSRLYQQLVKGAESVVSIQGEVDDRRGPSALYIFALPKPGEDISAIRDQIFSEIKKLAHDGPTDDEMEKLRNTVSNDAVRGRQSTLYRAQRIAEFTLYDGDPTLFDHELNYYLKVTADQIREATAKFLDVDNRVVLDVIPATMAEAAESSAASAQPQADGAQPTAPMPQVPAKEPAQSPAATDIPTPLSSGTPEPERAQPLSELPAASETGTEPLHP